MMRFPRFGAAAAAPDPNFAGLASMDPLGLPLPTLAGLDDLLQPPVDAAATARAEQEVVAPVDEAALRQQLIANLGCRVEEQRMTVEGVETNLFLAGDGPPLLLLHGLTQSGALSWYPVIEPLSHLYRVIAPDLPGFGASAQPALYSTHFLNEWFVGLMAVLELPSATVIGTSQGGAVALHCALHAPALLERLVLVNTAGFSDLWTPGIAGFALRSSLMRLAPIACTEQWFVDYLFFDAHQLDERFALLRRYIRSRMLRTSSWPAEWMARSLTLNRPLTPADLERIAQPTLLIWGQHDRLFSPTIGETAATRLPNAQLFVIPHAGHVVHLEQPQAFLSILVSFLTGHLSPALEWTAQL